VLGGEVHDAKAIGADAHLGRARGQQLSHIHAGAAWDDLHIQPALLVLAGGQRLIDAAMLGLGSPVGGEADHSGASRRGRNGKHGLDGGFRRDARPVLAIRRRTGGQKPQKADRG
jgi:hypothetical protein